MNTSELRKLAEERLDEYEAHILIKDGTIYYPSKAIINFALSFHEQASKDTKERLKIQIDLNDKLLLELKESTQRIIELEGELSELINP